MKYEKKLKAEYASYVEFCRLTKGIPMPIAMFKEQMHELYVRGLAELQRDKLKGADDIIYLSRRHDGDKIPYWSELGSCDRCEHPVVLDKLSKDIRQRARLIVCNECLPAIADGMTIDQALKDMMENL